jgi:hypothetical protein
MVGEESFFFEEEGIDLERIANDKHLVANELCCAICQGLLWKPRSCASCQHLFCNKCIRTWLKVNSTSCPFRCIPYEEKRAAPHIQSLLARLSIRCRNSSFGCTEILSYDSLEQHETEECHFPTKQCRICGIYILIEDIDQHHTFCVPTTLECSICKLHIERELFGQHATECLQERLNQLIGQIVPSPDVVAVPTNDMLAFAQGQQNQNFFTRLNFQLQRFLLIMPRDDLIGREAVVQARQRNNCARIWAMFRLILLNRSRSPQILMLLFFFGIGGILGCLIVLSSFIQKQVNTSMYRSFVLIIAFSGLFSFAFPVLLGSLNDTSIIILSTFTLLLGSSLCPELPLDNFEVRQNNILISIAYFIFFLTFKLSLLMIRLYCWFIPPYITAGCLAWITIFITYHIRRFSIGRE